MSSPSPSAQQLDQFFTPFDIAKCCYTFYCDTLRNRINLSDYTFLEPSAGDGAFYDLLPKGRRLGFDLDPKHSEIQPQNYLHWLPKADDGTKYLVIGNPPFGGMRRTGERYLDNLFVNHSLKFADYVGFLVSQAFKNGYKPPEASRSAKVPPIAGLDLGEIKFRILERKLYCGFYIFAKGNLPLSDTCHSYIDIARTNFRGRSWRSVDCYISVESWGSIKFLWQWDDSLMSKGNFFAINIKRDKEKILSLLSGTDWDALSYFALQGSRKLSRHSIYAVLVGAGFTDGTLL